MDAMDRESFIAQNLRSGKVGVFDSLMDSHYENLCAYAYSLTNNHADSEDIVQNVFTRLWIKRRNIKLNLPVKNFLYRSVYNEFVDQYRKSKHITYLEDKYLRELDSIVHEEPKNLQKLIGMVNSEIEKLPPKCKRVFLLNKKEGLTHIEISDHLNISIKTVEWHITQAFKILRGKLNPNFTDPILFLLFGHGPGASMAK